MKTALLLTNSAETQRTLTEILGAKTNLVLLPPPVDASRASFDALFATWLRLVDAVILDAASLQESSRWGIESLAAAPLREHQAVVVRATAAQQALHPMRAGWLIISDADSVDQLKQMLGTFFELRNTQAKLKRADALISRRGTTPVAPQPAAVPTALPSSVDAYRYRDALKNVSKLLAQQLDEPALLRQFAEFIRELLGVGKFALFTRRVEPALFPDNDAPLNDQLLPVASAGVAQQILKNLRLTTTAGIGGYLATQAKILRRVQSEAFEYEFNAEISREFELLGTDVAVPIFDDDQLLGFLTFGGKITGETVSGEELELVYHVLAQLGQALRRTRLEQTVARQQRFMSEVLANVQSGVIVIGQNGRILHLNRAAAGLLELRNTQIVGQPVGKLPSRVADVLFESLQTGREIREREVTLPKSNRPLSVSATPFPVDLGGATLPVAVALVEDLTQAKLHQARARELADKEFFTRLASRLSHELKNSLVSIKIFAQLLPERYDEKEFRDQFSTVVTNEVNRVDVLVNNLTFFSHPLGLVHEEVVLTDLIETCLNNVGQEFSRKQLAQIVAVGDKSAPPPTPGVPVVTVKKTFGHKLARIEADKIRLMQAFEHVLRNAYQSMPTGGRLAISTSDAQSADFADGPMPVGGAVRVEWQDTGEGIALENLKRVTDPFVTTRNVGVGLGLTIVKKIIERHSGQLEIDSLLGRGTKVVMLMPVKAQQHREDALVDSDAQRSALETDNAEALDRFKQPLDQEHGERS
jgi:nitrogen-specific signal transduction histidine kinase